MKDVDVYDIKPITLNKKPRQQQLDLLEFTKKSVLDNKKFIMVEAPTGSGKSYFVVMFMEWFKKNYNISAQFDILTNSKILQEQYTRDFDFMNSLWGKGSYECEKHNTDCGTGQEWCRIQNTKCEQCPYSIAKAKFEMGDVALTNFHLFLTYQVYMPQAWKRSSNVLIIDEAQDIYSVFGDFISTKISKPLLKRNGLTDEEIAHSLNIFGQYPEDLTADEFVRIVYEEFLPGIKSVINRLAREASDGNINAVNYLQSLGNNLLKWELLYDEYHKMKDNWVVEIELIKKYSKDSKLIDEYYEFSAQPVWAYPYLAEKIWDKYDYIIFMSGTILDKNLFSKINGIDVTKSEYISLESTFPVENRPIYYFHKTGKQTYATKNEVWPKQKIVLEKVLKKHKKDKGIIHTANYELQNWVAKAFNNDRVLTHDTSNRSDVLQLHYNSTEPTVLVSPSMMTGIDLHSDYSRHQTILKMPFPNLKSKIVKKRMETIKEWYGWKTCVDLIQMYGRSVRSVDDHANTYILDSCFSDVLKWNSHYFPKWIKDAIQYIE